jgi:hypothetical protein
MLDEAKEHDMIVYWGSTGFSVRMPVEPPFTLVYGFPPDSFQVNTGKWPLDVEGRAAFDQRLRDTLGFAPKGKFSNILHLDAETEKQARSALEMVWAEVDRMIEEADAVGSA